MKIYKFIISSEDVVVVDDVGYTGRVVVVLAPDVVLARNIAKQAATDNAWLDAVEPVVFDLNLACVITNVAV